MLSEDIWRTQLHLITHSALCIVSLLLYISSTIKKMFPAGAGAFLQDAARASKREKPPAHSLFIRDLSLLSESSMCVRFIAERRRGAAERDKGRICADIRGATLALQRWSHTSYRYYIFFLIRSLPMATFLVWCLILDCQVNAFAHLKRAT
jgi:hypothetical protein